MTRLFHYSEEAGIQCFTPRPSQYTDDPVVWALDERQRHKYLLAELNRCDIELRLTPSLWWLHHAAVTSTLGFSCIRLRNARIPNGEAAIARRYL